MVRKFLLAIALVSVGLTSVVRTQGNVATSSSKLAWDQVADTLINAQSYTYQYYLDNLAAVPLTTVVCSGTISPFQCEAPFPAIIPGNHTISITASNSDGTSPKSNLFTFKLVVIPVAPGNLHVK